ncbi:uncharacterized protein K452DRAFT_327331 [Aplosporella prunicola CBS 121167]|uniref:PIN domain-containing protein n=1 Tax=Aplosporella prunicola CBS 121167 TaxID=1176127 RepID=A0A6A6BA09_9PEZI|nr:uncharacterized protein K452DRAFT_327331 [Aplosporella prunicola CBS 121167]KAF2141112.1 hypothetical protein K452DRAFT_327331 [Aplosporella prunicola CBS 121167]
MRSHAPPRPHPPSDPPARKVFNCIVDETAFVAGVKKSTRDGIRKWINNGSMRLFVPLYTLEQVDRLKRAGGKTSADATEALMWLDDVTSLPEVHQAGLVQLQGGDEMYTRWADVEAFLLPETLLSMPEEVDEPSDDDSPDTKTPESPRSVASNARTNKTNGTTNGKHHRAKSTVPPAMQPFFNHLIWRIHHEQNPNFPAESFILLTNDPKKQAIAQRFSVRAKRLEQMRDIIGREERDYKNRQAFLKREEKEEKTLKVEAEEKDASDDEEEDEVVFKSRGSSVSRPKSGQQQVLDPDDFGRSRAVAPPVAPAAPAAPRGGRGGGRGGFRGGRGAASAAAPSTPRGGGGGGRGEGTPRPAEPPSGPIDPDSFTRPAPAVRTLRGGRRKLWEPA